MRSGSHPDVAGGEPDPSGRWAGDEGFGDAPSSPLSRGALRRQKGCPVVPPWVAASPPAWLLCSPSSQTRTCGVNPIISLRNDRLANHQHGPCQSTARLGDVALTPPGFCCSATWPSPSSCDHPALFGALLCYFKTFFYQVPATGCEWPQTQSKNQLPPWRCLAVNSE